jgi:hypothetical protein
MSAPKQPVQQHMVSVSDPNNVPELFANSLIGIQVRDGLCHLTFGVVRPKHNQIGAPSEEHVVSGRLILPFQVLDAMTGMVSDLKRAMTMNAAIGSQGPVN